MHLLKHSWWLITPQTIQTCFKKAGFCSELEAPEKDMDDLLMDLPISGEQFEQFFLLFWTYYVAPFHLLLLFIFENILRCLKKLNGREPKLDLLWERVIWNLQSVPLVTYFVNYAPVLCSAKNDLWWTRIALQLNTIATCHRQNLHLLYNFFNPHNRILPLILQGLLFVPIFLYESCEINK